MTLDSAPSLPAPDQTDAPELPRRRRRHERPRGMPPCTWPGWPELVAPLAAFLATPRGRTWAELDAWAKGQGLPGDWLINAICWLENQGRVASVGEPPRARWVATGQG